jgi:hypothetical protein
MSSVKQVEIQVELKMFEGRRSKLEVENRLSTEIEVGTENFC